MNHYVTLALTNTKSSVHLHALYSPRTALRMFTPRRDHLMVCLLYLPSHLCPVVVSVCTCESTPDIFSSLVPKQTSLETKQSDVCQQFWSCSVAEHHCRFFVRLGFADRDLSAFCAAQGVVSSNAIAVVMLLRRI